MSSVVLGTHLVLRGDGTISLALDEDVHILKEDAYDALIDGIGQLKDENAKLRELIVGVHEALCTDKAGIFHKLIIASMEDDMRELGMEVD